MKVNALDETFDFRFISLHWYRSHVTEEDKYWFLLNCFYSSFFFFFTFHVIKLRFPVIWIIANTSLSWQEGTKADWCMCTAVVQIRSYLNLVSLFSNIGVIRPKSNKDVSSVNFIGTTHVNKVKPGCKCFQNPIVWVDDDCNFSDIS